MKKIFKLIIAFIIGLFFVSRNEDIINLPSHEEYTSYEGSAHYNSGRRNKFKARIHKT